MKYSPYSHSKISVHQNCPRKFKYQYIDKLPVEWSPQFHFDKGIFLHSLLEHQGDLKKVKTTSDWKGIKKHNLLSSSDIKEFYLIYKSFIKSKAGRSILSKKALFKEYPIGLDEDFSKVQFKDPKAMFRGFVDAIYVNEKTNQAILVDWKSGKLKSPQDQSYQQLLFYGIALFELIPFDSIILVYAYLEHNKLNIKELKRSELPSYKKALTDTISNIEKDTLFEKHQSGLCNYCDFRDHCDKD